LLAELLVKMGSVLGYQFDKVYVKKGVYYPEGLGDIEREQHALWTCPHFWHKQLRLKIHRKKPINDAPRVPLNAVTIKSAIVAALGGLLFGFDTAVIAGTTSDLTAVYSLTPALLGWTVSSALWGTIVGAMFAGVPGDRYGRRDSLRIMAILYVVSALGCGFAWNWSSLVFFPLSGRPRYWWILGPWTDVHCRDRAKPLAGPFGWTVPI